MTFSHSRQSKPWSSRLIPGNLVAILVFNAGVSPWNLFSFVIWYSLVSAAMQFIFKCPIHYVLDPVSFNESIRMNVLV